MKLAGVIVTYNPPAGLADRVRAALEQTDLLVIVDNGSQLRAELEALPPSLSERLQLIDNRQNRGLAAALNQGIARCAELRAGKALLLDHDSTIEPGLVAALCAAEAGLAARAPVAVLVPSIRYAHPEIRCRWPSSAGHRGPMFHFEYAAGRRQPVAVDLAIGSGMLLDIETWERLGRFDESLFIDLVDTEFCLRARAAGYQVVAVPQVALQHALGQVSQQRLLGVAVYPTHHSATRHYYINRNRIILARRYARRFPSWMAYELLGAIKLTLKTALFETDRLAKIRCMLRGTLDGLRGRSGPMPTPP